MFNNIESITGAWLQPGTPDCETNSPKIGGARLKPGTGNYDTLNIQIIAKLLTDQDLLSIPKWNSRGDLQRKKHMEKTDLDRLIAQALQEDLGAGDITSNATIDENQHCTFHIVAREPMVVCGVDIACHVLTHFKQQTHIISQLTDGTMAQHDDIIIHGEGNTRMVLAAERVMLNLLQHLSGIATETKHFVDAVAGTNTQILDTRKTLPGLRELQKYAVKTGGGENHRMGLYDAILIKDNHIAACQGSVEDALKRAKAAAPDGMMVEVECDTLAQVEEAINAGATRILLDNMSIEMLAEAVTLGRGKIFFEASGGVTRARIRHIAETGVNAISVGYLTHSVKAVDIGLAVI